ncbi:MAG: hypothetical protein QNJ63_05435 [Calothrix sp. MO_192.B10]|nr:hypothetical protein [Calothrix sp. MO_192.B10]
MRLKRNLIFVCCLCIAAYLCILPNFFTPGTVSAFKLQKSDNPVTLLKNLGNHHHKITTNSPEAQRYFDQGLILVFGFNHGEALRSFQQATKLDPNCAMCYWGMALSLGPNINAPMGKESMPTAYQAIQKAQQLASKASKVEQGYIQALSQRYSPQPVKNRQPLDLAYATAMRKLAQQYPDDLDAATLFAESMMDLIPWSYWTEDGQPKPEAKEIIDTLESVLKRNPNHPGAIHYYIHAVEASPRPERAEAAADRLRNLVPGSGHLVHMPSHIYLRIGRYHDAAIANQKAIKADEAFLASSQQRGLYSGVYYPHNIHFFWSSASMEGRSSEAIAAARKLVGKVSPQQVKQMPGAEIFLPTPYFSLVQFRKWDEALTEPKPSPEFPYTLAMWHYARGMAWAAKGNLASVIREQSSIKNLLSTETSKIKSASFPATSLIKIATHLLDAEIANLGGKNSQALAEYQAAVQIQDNLPYTEPPYWYYPVRQSLGVALLKLDQAKEAEAVYRQDLLQHPHNGRSLYGLAQSLQAQGKQKAATETQQQFQQAWSKADIQL